jgi:hypothetical protein
LLQQLLSIPAGQTISIERLKLEPVWDPLRKDPRFHKLLSSEDSAQVARPLAIQMQARGGIEPPIRLVEREGLEPSTPAL